MNPTISVITVTLNAAKDLPRLIESLRRQTDRGFDFVVVDGQSTDGTCGMIEASRDLITHSVSEPDEGFYDALNKAIRALRTEYYVVAGADDTFEPQAIAQYKKATVDATVDVVVASVKAGERVRSGFHANRAWLGHAAMVTSHSVGMLFRAKLHDRFGMYSRRYPLLADGYFIKCVCCNPDVRVAEASFLAGEFAMDGLSNRNFIGALCESWQIQIATGEKPLLQYLLFQLRLLKNVLRVARP